MCTEKISDMLSSAKDFGSREHLKFTCKGLSL